MLVGASWIVGRIVVDAGVGGSVEAAWLESVGKKEEPCPCLKSRPAGLAHLAAVVAVG